MWHRADRDCEWWRAIAPGPPSAGDQAFRVVRARGASGHHKNVLAFSDLVASVEIGDEIRVALTDGSTHTHRHTTDGWHIELHAGGARSGIDLGGGQSTPVAGASVVTPPEGAVAGLDISGSAAVPAVVHLGEQHYRRSEQSWTSADKPTADVSLWWASNILHVTVDVHQSHRTFAAASAVNAYDNEFPDINGDGVQLYLSSDKGFGGWILVPEREATSVRIRQLEGWPATATISAVWEPVGAGYRLAVEITDCVPKAIDLLINEMPLGRERRRGQLVLSESRGDFIYLRGDRHSTDRLIPLRLPND
jgi:hypothetical protein